MPFYLVVRNYVVMGRLVVCRLLIYIANPRSEASFILLSFADSKVYFQAWTLRRYNGSRYVGSFNTRIMLRILGLDMLFPMEGFIPISGNVGELCCLSRDG